MTRSVPPPPRRSELRTLHLGEDGFVGTFRNVVIVTLYREITIDMLARSVEANRSLRQEYPQGAAALSLADTGIKLPSAEVRKAAADAIATVRDNLICAAQVMSGDGFWASTARSVVTAIEMLRPDDKPRKTFGTLPDATAWMTLRMNESPAFAGALALAARESLELAHREG